jgi:DNA segregation ATPase FtsK/SpoIIIE, S-DNA-T family
MPSSSGGAGKGVLSNKFKEIVAILIIGTSLFAFVSTASYYDEASYAGGNLCGATGQALARFMLHASGYACYAFYSCLGIWGLVLLTRKELPSIVSKVVGLVFFTVFLAAFLSHLLKGCPAAIPDYGGLVGKYIDHFLAEKLALGVIGTRIILVVLFLITFILATDWVFFSAVLAFVSWARRRIRSWKEKVRQAKAAAEKGRREKEARLTRERALAAKEKKAALAAQATKAAEAAVAAQATKAAEAATTEKRKKEEALARLMEKEEEKLRKAEKKREKQDTGPARAAAAVVPAGRGGDSGAASSEPAGGDRIQYAPPPVKKNLNYETPSTDLLDDTKPVPHGKLEKMIADTSSLLESTLQSFKIDTEVVEIQRGPVITMFELELAPGIKVERLRALEDDIAMAVKAPSVRIVAPIPGKSTAGIEIPNAVREDVRLKDLFLSRRFKGTKAAVPICLGKDAAGNPLIDDLAKMPHLLVAGSTGSGKSVCLNSIIMSILFTRNPEQVKMILVDPKMVELSLFKDIPHLMCPVVTEMKRAGAILEWATREMDSRYNLLHMAGVRNIYAYNKLGIKELRERLGDLADDEGFVPFLPFVVIIVDELADLMMTGAREVETTITRLAQKSRAVGLHLVLATQRPSTNVITGLIKANMPTRIAFMVASKIDSRVILDVNGAEKLLGQGDMLYMAPRTSAVQRAQGTFVDDGEVRNVTRFLKKTCKPVFEPELSGKGKKNIDPASIDDLYDEAAEFVIETQRGSASLLQRHFSIGYTRASRLIDLMNQDGVLGDFKGSKAREVMVNAEEWAQRKGGSEKNGR